MMLIDRYIARHVAAGVAIVFTVLVSLFFIRDLIIDLDDVGRGAFGYTAVLWFVVMRLPDRMYALLPASTLIGGLLGLGWLARNAELTAMRAAGTSVARLVYAVMQAGVIVIAAGLVVGEWLAPWTERSAHDWRTAAITGQSGVRSGSGFWGRHGQRFFHFGEVLPNERLRDVRMFEFNEEGRLVTAWSARRAVSIADEPDPEEEVDRPGRAWRLQEVEVSRFREGAVETTRIESVRERLPIGASELESLAMRPEWLRLPDLIAYTRHLRENGLGVADYDAALWSRIMAPFLTAAMLFTAVVLVLGPLGQAGFGTRILVGIGCGIGFHVVQRVAIQMGVVHDWLAPLSAAAPVVAMTVLGGWWLRRAVT